MKIAFTGKGGSGKTTMSSLFARIAADDGYHVLALDADINQHQASALRYKGAMRSMGMEADVIKGYLKGENNYVASDMHKTTPPQTGSRLLYLERNDWFIDQFAALHQGVWIAGAGEIPDGNVGIRCYHSLNGTVELVLSHMIDRHDDIVVVDMTAGADAFSSSLFTKVDVLVLVVEPTLKSIGVYRQFQDHVAEYGVPLVVIANKIQDQSDRDFIGRHIPDVTMWIMSSDSIRQRERGHEDVELESAMIVALRQLRTVLLEQPIDWQQREELSHRMYRRAVKGAVIDADFSLVDASSL